MAADERRSTPISIMFSSAFIGVHQRPFVFFSRSDGRGSDRSPDREGGVAPEYEIVLAKRRLRPIRTGHATRRPVLLRFVEHLDRVDARVVANRNQRDIEFSLCVRLQAVSRPGDGPPAALRLF